MYSNKIHEHEDSLSYTKIKSFICLIILLLISHVTIPYFDILKYSIKHKITQITGICLLK